MKTPALLCASAFLLNFAFDAPAAVHYVDLNSTNPVAPYAGWNNSATNVQAALNSSATGDEVWVASGTYFDNITQPSGVALYGGFAGNETALDQRDWRNRITILDGRQSNSVVIVAVGATLATRIDGFTIRNGNADSGGGIRCEFTSATIVNDIIVQNTAITGAGIECLQSAVLIQSNMVQNNAA